ncbi:hypothetical protein FHS44_003499 [Streptosporangium saharense]|uniref:Uncharacterized protein n=1 Tax=Streptosporangium saharense TaxID=1706840 RepID=A0A7W7VN20_9ACTN|nr:hypothetical protein [Streptosporangium saharense]
MNDFWVAIVFKTANSHRRGPYAVGMVSVEAGRISESFNTLIHPPARYSCSVPFNVGLRGISESNGRMQPLGKRPFRRSLHS